jgi:hypothetical protein
MILHQISEYGEKKIPRNLTLPRVLNTTRARALGACALHAPVFWFIKRAKWAAVRPPYILQTLIQAKTFLKEIWT